MLTYAGVGREFPINSILGYIYLVTKSTDLAGH
jgi:hypothetical protein